MDDYRRLGAIENAYNEETRKELSRNIFFFPGIWSPQELESRREELQQTEVIFTTWGMFSLTEEKIGEFFPNLKAVFYSAGSVQYFAKPFLKKRNPHFQRFRCQCGSRGRIYPGADHPGWEGLLQASRLYKETGNFQQASAYSHKLTGNYGDTVGIIGAGTIGRMVIERLKSLYLKVLVFDPFLPQEKAAAMGVELCSLPELFSRRR